MIQALVAARRADPVDDVVSHLVNPEFALDDDTVMWMVFTLVMGGAENPAATIGNSMLYLAQDTALRARLAADHSLIPAAADELLRQTSSAVSLARNVTTDVELEGAQLRAGDRMLVWLPGAVRRRRHHVGPALHARAHQQPLREAAVNDPLTYASPPDICWTRTNMAEVTPGVITPLGWSFYGPIVDVSSRLGFSRLGAVPKWALGYPDDVAEHIIGIFHGRPVLNVTTLRAMMSGSSGVSGDDVERDIVGSVRAGVSDRSYGWRVPAVVAKAGITLARSSAAARKVLEETTAWWSTRFGPAGIVDGTDPRIALSEAVAHFGDAVVAQSRNRMLFQGASSQVVALAEKSGHPELASALLAAPGGLEEAAVADDLRALAADRLDLAGFVARHGFHGPNAATSRPAPGGKTPGRWSGWPRRCRPPVVAVRAGTTSAGPPRSPPCWRVCRR